MTSNKQTAIIPDEKVISKIYFIKGQKVMLDRDLAMLQYDPVLKQYRNVCKMTVREL